MLDINLEELYTAITNTLASLEINLDCGGHSYDNTMNMSKAYTVSKQELRMQTNLLNLYSVSTFSESS